MKHFVLSNAPSFEEPHIDVNILPPTPEAVAELKEDTGRDFYLCDGGPFAVWLLECGLIDVLKRRVSPVILGGGAPLFGNCSKAARFEFVRSIACDHGVQINEYKAPTSTGVSRANRD